MSRYFPHGPFGVGIVVAMLARKKDTTKATPPWVSLSSIYVSTVIGRHSFKTRLKARVQFPAEQLSISQMMYKPYTKSRGAQPARGLSPHL